VARRWRGQAGAAALCLAVLAGPALAEAQRTAQLSPERLLQGGTRDRAGVAVAVEGGVPFLVRFHGTVRGLETGTPVEINGIRAGAVRSVALAFDAAARRFAAVAEIALQPDRLPPVDGRRPRDAAEAVAAVETMVRAGMRARLGTTSPLGGETVVALAMLGEAPGEGLVRGGAAPEIPAAPSRAEATAARLDDLLERLSQAPVEQMIADLQAAMAALRALATGPELRDALTGLRDGAAELRVQVARLGARADPLLASLNEAARGANRTIASLDRQLGERSPLLAEVHALLGELNGAARAMRLMADYLERNPDALIRGKSDSRR